MRAETSRPLLPSFLFCIISFFGILLSNPRVRQGVSRVIFKLLCLGRKRWRSGMIRSAARFSSGSVQLLLREKLRHQVSYLFVIQVGERKVGISMDADFREVD